jgi:hypothetical protein
MEPAVFSCSPQCFQNAVGRCVGGWTVIGCDLGVPAGEELECFSGVGVVVGGAVNEEGLVGIPRQVKRLVVDLQPPDDRVPKSARAPRAVEQLVLTPPVGEVGAFDGQFADELGGAGIVGVGACVEATISEAIWAQSTYSSRAAGSSRIHLVRFRAR